MTGAGNAINSDNDQKLTLERVRLQNSTGWGVRQVKGVSQLTNCLVTNNPNGLYYEKHKPSQSVEHDGGQPPANTACIRQRASLT